MLTFRHHLLALVSAGAMVASFGGPAFAGSITIDPSGLDPSDSPFSASTATIKSNALIDFNEKTGKFTEAGLVDITQFQDASSNAVSNVDQHGTYQIYAEFFASGTVSCANPTLCGGQATSITLQLFANSGGGNDAIAAKFTIPTTSTPSDFSNPGVFGVTPGTSNSSLVATGNGSGIVSLVALIPNLTTSDNIVTSSASLFTFQIPFIIDLQASTANTSGVVTYNNKTSCLTGSDTDCRITIQNGGGNLSFAAAVPEPASLTLLGAGLLGLSAAMRRRRKRS